MTEDRPIHCNYCGKLHSKEYSHLDALPTIPMTPSEKLAAPRLSLREILEALTDMRQRLSAKCRKDQPHDHQFLRLIEASVVAVEAAYAHGLVAALKEKQ